MSEQPERVEKNRVIEFEEEGVIFILPPELDDVYVKREPLNPKTHTKYKNKRDVIRVNLIVSADAADKLAEVDLELTLIVYYTYEDAFRAKDEGNKKPFPLIYDDENDKLYEPHLDRKVIYQPVVGSRRWVGSMMIKMSKKKWDDPLISVGP
ncbi:MAG: hypothetical protein ABUK16_10995 [Anaerolineales bacterium]